MNSFNLHERIFLNNIVSKVFHKHRVIVRLTKRRIKIKRKKKREVRSRTVIYNYLGFFVLVFFKMPSRETVRAWNFFCDVLSCVPVRINELLRRKILFSQLHYADRCYICSYILLSKWGVTRGDALIFVDECKLHGQQM